MIGLCMVTISKITGVMLVSGNIAPLSIVVTILNAVRDINDIPGEH